MSSSTAKFRLVSPAETVRLPAEMTTLLKAGCYPAFCGRTATNRQTWSKPNVSERSGSAAESAII